MTEAVKVGIKVDHLTYSTYQMVSRLRHDWTAARHRRCRMELQSPSMLTVIRQWGRSCEGDEVMTFR
jgi:hypothetical protein